MNRRKALLLNIILTGFLVLIAFDANSRESFYQGKLVREDQPQGDLQYFDVDYQSYVGDGAGFWDGSVRSGNFVVPLVFAGDGKVYTRNIGNDGSSLWIEGVEEGDNLVFFPNSEISFYPASVFYFGSDPFSYLKLGIGKPDENKLEEDGTIEKLVFTKTEEGGYTMKMPESTGIFTKSPWGTNVFYEYSLKPSQLKPVTPPKGYKEEDYQIDFIPFPQTYAPDRFHELQHNASLRLKVVRTNDEFYVKGLSFLADNQDLWLKGNIVGKKVVFPHASYIGVGRSNAPVYANVVEYEKEFASNPYGHGSNTINVKALEEDMIFDYDPESGTLSNPSACWNFNLTPNNSWSMSLSSENYYLAFMGAKDFYNQPQLKKIPDDHQYKPLMPRVELMNRPSGVLVSYLDADGYMMDPYKLYVKKINPEDNEPVEMEFVNIDNWEKERSDMYPFGTSYFITTQGVEGVGVKITNYQAVYDTDAKAYRYELYYIDENDIFTSENTGIDYNFQTENDDSPYYDLTGREINPKNLPSGIYIHKGKKILIP